MGERNKSWISEVDPGVLVIAAFAVVAAVGLAGVGYAQASRHTADGVKYSACVKHHSPKECE